MQSFHLRFKCDDACHEFDARLACLQNDINDGFIAFRSKTGCATGKIELFHPTQGWELMAIDGVYPLIKNPLALDYTVARMVLADTYEWLEHIEQTERQSSHIKAIQRRAQFKLVR